LIHTLTRRSPDRDIMVHVLNSRKFR